MYAGSSHTILGARGMNTSQYAPANETALTLDHERADFDGIVLAGVAYGGCMPVPALWRVR
jgi:hypothetical protein